MVVDEVVGAFLEPLVKAIALSMIAFIFSGMDPSVKEESYGRYRIQTNQLNGRLEALTATLNNEVTGSNLTNAVKHHVQQSFAAGDKIGVLIDEKLGGFANETFNVVSMNPSTHESWRKKVTEPIYDYLTQEISKNDPENVMLWFTVIPFYEGKNSTRPNSFAVVVLGINLTSQMMQYINKGFVPNPPKAEMSEAIVPYLYKTGNITGQGDKQCIYVTVKVGESQLEERVEMVTLEFLTTDISPCSKVSGNKTNEVKLKENDVRSLLISEKFGGRSDVPFNVVAMDPTAARELKTRVEQPIMDYISSSKNEPEARLWLNMILIYTDALATRPAGFVVRSTVQKGKLFDAMYIPNTSKKIPSHAA